MKLVGNHELQSDRGSGWYEERGHALLTTGDTSRAIEAFELSVTINAARVSSWSALERLHRTNGDTCKADIAARHLATLRRLPPTLVRAGSLFCDGEMTAAKAVLQEFLHNEGSHAEAFRLLGRIAHHENQLEAAAMLFEQVLAIAPDYRAARADYVRTLIEQQRYLEARQALDELLELEPGHRDYLFLGANIQAGLGQHEHAIRGYQQVLARTRGWPELWLLLGNSLKAAGRAQEAVEAHRAAAAARPSFGDAWWSLANLKTYLFSPEEIGRMRSLEAAPVTRVVDRIPLCFALGKALEDRASYEESWRYYERGNALHSERVSYDPHSFESEVERLIQTYTAGTFATRTGLESPACTPIFIVGLPRSGSTLVEQILASHSRVEGTAELPVVGRIAFGEDDYQRLGARYLEEARSFAPHGKPFFIDKRPDNFRHIGLIHRMLPTAKLIDVRRDPLACCFSNFKQLYARGNDFTYSIDALARYYNGYLRLMDHWDAILPNRILRVSYENLVDDLETNVLRLLRYCELDPEPGCLRFHTTERPVNTASSEQVRQPVYRTGLRQWRHYEPWLGDLRAALRRA
ncbi:MAG: sulfotransferase [Proteobacteria bacterium]|nr:sulfotransferase [Pseudomonadota bacterium]